LSVIFGFQQGGKNWDITRRSEIITMSLSAQERRLEEGGEICAVASVKGDTPWDGIRRVPEVPTCALPVPSRVAASTPKEAEALVDFAVKSEWPFRQTLALRLGLGTGQEFEFSVTYDSPRFAEKPDLEMLWNGLWYI
jgi:hypothetical protein